MIGVAMLHGVLKISREGYGIVGMPAIEAVASAGALGRLYELRAIVEMRERNGAVPAAEIPFAAPAETEATTAVAACGPFPAVSMVMSMMSIHFLPF